MSGAADIIYFSGESLESFLYSKSPIALDKFKFPFILPSDTNKNQFTRTSSILNSL
jgi:hypothetical protein